MAAKKKLESLVDGAEGQDAGEDTFDDFERSRKAIYEPDEPHPLLFAGVKEPQEELEEEPEAEPEAGQAAAEPAGEAQVPEKGAAPAGGKSKTPLMRLKVEGVEFPIYDYDDVVTLAQKGLHYGKSMAELSEYRKILRVIDENDDIKQELLDRMRGGQPKEKAAEPVKEPEPPKFELPPVRDDETYEDWMKRVMSEDLPRVVRSEAERIAAAKATDLVRTSTQEMEERQKRDRLVDAYRGDPLFPQMMAVVQHAIQTKAMPPQILAMADSDPNVFAWFMDKARQQALFLMSRQQAQATGQAPAGPANRSVPTAPHVAAPHAESGGSRKAPPAKKAQTLEDMDSSDFRALMERVKAGRVQ